ncbi:hypothetical protein CvBV-C30_1 [Cotesia vestalis bracovirus]|nr:hypothetical protein CvBV-C30_1 [Cotesia vestalis bracovirus]QZB49020.1 hyp [Cotesia vestalis bracovirus]
MNPPPIPPRSQPSKVTSNESKTYQSNGGRMNSSSLPPEQERLNLFGTSQPPRLPPRRDPPPIPPKPAHFSNTYKGSLPPRQ